MANKNNTLKDPRNSFQDLILMLQDFWAQNECVILQPYDMEVGAGTFHPATILRALGSQKWNAAYVQPSRRPTDGRFGERKLKDSCRRKLLDSHATNWWFPY